MTPRQTSAIQRAARFIEWAEKEKLCVGKGPGTLFATDILSDLSEAFGLSNFASFAIATAQAIEARQGGNGEAGAVHESAVAESDAP